jgi:neutral ceramidase
MVVRVCSIACLALLLAVGLLHPAVAAEPNSIQAGVYLKNINPKTMPVWVNGNIAGVKSDRIHDPLNARCLVLSDGTTKLAICVVDSCAIPLDLTDEARRLAAERTGIDPSCILISATHTHSAVSVLGAHGTPVQEDYAAALPGWIAEGIEEANKRLAPARVGTASVVCDKYVYCRRWMMKPGTADTIPFTGRTSNQVNMNPGYDNPNRLSQVGPVDNLIPILSVQTKDGKPLALFCCRVQSTSRAFATRRTAGLPGLDGQRDQRGCELHRL